MENVIDIIQLEKSLSFLRENERIGKGYSSSRKENVDIDFNIFEVISDLYFRENIHSDLIAYFLNTQESHHCDDVFFKSFLRLIEKLGRNIDIEEYKDATILRENGKIDILIKSETSRKAIIIENKINNAPDMSRQLPRYYDYLVPSYSIDAIVYIPLDKTKMPDQCDWTEQDKNNILPLLVIIPAYDKSSINLVNDWLIPTLPKINNIDVLSTIRQYSSLIKKLNSNNMDTIILEKFYQGLMQGDNMQTAMSIRDMLNDIPNYKALRIQEKFGWNCFPFSKIWICKSRAAVFEAAKFNNYDLKLEIWCNELDYRVLFWRAPDDQEEGFDKIVRSLTSLNGFQKEQEYKCQYFKCFDYKDEVGLFSFVESLINELRNMLS